MIRNLKTRLNRTIQRPMMIPSKSGHLTFRHPIFPRAAIFKNCTLTPKCRCSTCGFLLLIRRIMLMFVCCFPMGWLAKMSRTLETVFCLVIRAELFRGATTFIVDLWNKKCQELVATALFGFCAFGRPLHVAG